MKKVTLLCYQLAIVCKELDVRRSFCRLCLQTMWHELLVSLVCRQDNWSCDLSVNYCQLAHDYEMSVVYTGNIHVFCIQLPINTRSSLLRHASVLDIDRVWFPVDLYWFIYSRLPNKLFQLRLMAPETHSRWNQPRKRERQCGLKHLAYGCNCWFWQLLKLRILHRFSCWNFFSLDFVSEIGVRIMRGCVLYVGEYGN